jgi:hypothetical protein
MIDGAFYLIDLVSEEFNRRLPEEARAPYEQLKDDPDPWLDLDPLTWECRIPGAEFDLFVLTPMPVTVLSTEMPWREIEEYGPTEDVLQFERVLRALEGQVTIYRFSEIMLDDWLAQHQPEARNWLTEPLARRFVAYMEGEDSEEWGSPAPFRVP